MNVNRLKHSKENQRTNGPVNAHLRYIIIIISIFIEDNIFSTTASLPYGPLVNTDIDYFRTFFVISSPEPKAHR